MIKRKSDKIKPNSHTTISFSELYADYSKHVIPVAEMKRTGKTMSRDLEQKQKKVLELLKKHKAVIDEIEEAMVIFAQYLVLEEPTVYIARTRDVKTDIEYFTAKTVWPLKDGKKKEVKIYLGKASDYNNDTQSSQAKRDAEIKMKQTLARRIREGSI